MHSALTTISFIQIHKPNKPLSLPHIVLRQTDLYKFEESRADYSTHGDICV